jgi:hypothetical protein
VRRADECPIEAASFSTKIGKKGGVPEPTLAV